ncbi:MAG TPA: methylaspartate mutase [Clostridiales bacterium UBA8153]|nr:methylaspartate mutase [Clostridiales bacterium UBA8153]
MEPKTILAADVGSTTTKVIMLEHDGQCYRICGRAAAPTTVEKPFLDVMIGLRNAVNRLATWMNRPLLRDNRLLIPGTASEGADVFLATSSAGGGLQMLVTGLVRSLTAESAQRAALGAGAVVMDVLSMDDTRLAVDCVQKVREMRPDMILFTGGTDEGSANYIAAVAEYLAAADPLPRFGTGFKMPVIYAGNIHAREVVASVLGGRVLLSMVDNVRPTLEKEVLQPARHEIHRVFLEHVMAQAPGYQTLLDWTGGRLQPTPLAVGKMVQQVAAGLGTDVVALDIGGATTDVFSWASGQFNRTVSANLGMSYSLGNVLKEASLGRVVSWLPFAMSEDELSNWYANKAIKPTTLPETLDELLLEHAAAREALRLAMDHHYSLAVTLKGIRQERLIDEVFEQKSTGQPLVDMVQVGAIIGSGGVLSHAPRRAQAALILLDALGPMGVTRLFVDSVFMLPHLGALSDLEPDAALATLWRECLVPLGTVVAPVGSGRPGHLLAQVSVEGTDLDLLVGQLAVLPLAPGQVARLKVRPAYGWDAGAGRNQVLETTVHGGEVGVILDGRGRPLELPVEPALRRRSLADWWLAMDAYPRAALHTLTGREVV